MTTFEIGSSVGSSDGLRAEVRALVIDPAARVLTHIVVEPVGREGLGGLVPLGTVDVAAGEIRLSCTQPEFQNLAPAEETLAEFVPGRDAPVQVLPPGWRGAGGPAVEGSSFLRAGATETVDIVPSGEVEEHSGDHVHATDGDIGQLRGVRVDPGSGAITHVLLREGHLWDRKEVAIPFDAVAGFADGIQLRITRQQVQDLPPAQ